MAYYFNLKAGDDLELMINVPYVMVRSLLDDDYCPVTCICEIIPYKAKVIGLVESNSVGNNEI